MGLLTLGRWAGSFYESGWSWNLRRQRKAGQRWVPSAEFVESGLITFYGATNIFLEHLGSQDGVWRPSDLEHLSITILFLGGGSVSLTQMRLSLPPLDARLFTNTAIGRLAC